MYSTKFYKTFDKFTEMLRSNKNKGFTFQRKVVKALQSSGVLKHEWDIYPTPKNVGGADIQIGLYNLFTFPFVIEVKNTIQCPLTSAIEQVMNYRHLSHVRFVDVIPELYPLIIFNNGGKMQCCTHFNVVLKSKFAKGLPSTLSCNKDGTSDFIYEICKTDKKLLLKNLNKGTISFDILNEVFNTCDIVNYQPQKLQMVIMSFELFVEIVKGLNK